MRASTLICFYPIPCSHQGNIARAVVTYKRPRSAYHLLLCTQLRLLLSYAKGKHLTHLLLLVVDLAALVLTQLGQLLLKTDACVGVGLCGRSVPIAEHGPFHITSTGHVQLAIHPHPTHHQHAIQNRPHSTQHATHIASHIPLIFNIVLALLCGKADFREPFLTILGVEHVVRLFQEILPGDVCVCVCGCRCEYI